LDTLEDRTVLSITPLVNLPVDVGTVTAVTDATTNVTTLQAPVTIAGQQAGTVIMDATTGAVANQGDVPILHLAIQPIHLSLLGLHVDTSAICLDVAAQPGQGVLGDVLAGLAANQTLSQILDQVDNVASDLGTLLGGLENLLDGGQLASNVGVLDQAMKVTGVFNTGVNGGATPTQAAGTCNILNLSVGPVNLNLLGLHVGLDNCADGPVTVDVTAKDGEGLLGDLLCGLADGGLAGLPVSRLIGRLDHLIDSLGNLADRLDEIEVLADRMVDQLTRIADRTDSLADLDRLINRINKVVNRLDKLIDNTDVSNQFLTRLHQAIFQVTRIVNRFQDLGFIDRTAANWERLLDRLFSQL